LLLGVWVPHKEFIPEMLKHNAHMFGDIESVNSGFFCACVEEGYMQLPSASVHLDLLLLLLLFCFCQPK